MSSEVFQDCTFPTQFQFIRPVWELSSLKSVCNSLIRPLLTSAFTAHYCDFQPWHHLHAQQNICPRWLSTGAQELLISYRDFIRRQLIGTEECVHMCACVLQRSQERAASLHQKVATSFSFLAWVTFTLQSLQGPSFYHGIAQREPLEIACIQGCLTHSTCKTCLMGRW